jgi:hypothetical protein
VTDAGELTASRTSRFAARAYRKALDRPGGGECANGLGLLGSRRDRYRDSSAGPPKDEPHHAPGPHRGTDESDALIVKSYAMSASKTRLTA